MRIFPGLARLALAPAGAACLLLPATAGHAQSPVIGRIVSSVVSADHVRLVIQAKLPADVRVETGDVRATVGGTAVPATVSAATPLPKADRRAVMVVVDTSGSMAGGGLVAAKAAATDFVRALPADVEVGLIAFANTVTIVAPVQSNRAAFFKGLTSLRAAGQTQLYDGLLKAVASMPADENRHIVVLSDGDDNRSRANLDATVLAVAHSGVTLDAIAFKTSGSQAATLQRLVGAGHGSVSAAANAAEIGAAFRSVAGSYAPRITVDIVRPAGVYGQAAVQVDMATAKGRVSAEATIDLGVVAPSRASSAASSGTPTPTTPSPTTPTATPAASAGPAPAAAAGHHGGPPVRKSLLAAAAALAIGLFGMIWLAMDSRSPAATRRRRMAEVSRYSLAGPPLAVADAGSGDEAGRFLVAARTVAGRALEKADLNVRLDARLSRAGLQILAPEFALSSASAA
ncbi:MAG: tight adherence protein, partial [Frankiales bacterium]|nr:tight adherence protein [Frankiales bacterium]